MNSITSMGAITGWPESERPRERLERFGAGYLSDADLVALLLRSGIAGKDAVALSREMISVFGGLRGLFQANRNDFRKIKGLGEAKIATILAATELARRHLKEKAADSDVIRDPKHVIDYLSYSLRDKKREIFKVLYLDRGNRVLGEEDLFLGTVSEAAVHPREVVRSAVERHASAVILIHNHPSGRIQPSAEDREVTRKIKEACAFVSVTVLDHIIIGADGYFSFNENQLLQ